MFVNVHELYSLISFTLSNIDDKSLLCRPPGVPGAPPLHFAPPPPHPRALPGAPNFPPPPPPGSFPKPPL